VSDSGELLGNYPQAFNHLGLILATQAVGAATTGPPRPPKKVASDRCAATIAMPAETIRSQSSGGGRECPISGVNNLDHHWW
jgi:hypothetical protein